jgi:hypothetical protein
LTNNRLSFDLAVGDGRTDEELASYMMHLRPFEAPDAPGTTKSDQENSTQDKDYTMVTFSTGDSMLPEEEYYMEQTLPMFYMPESDEIVEYLATMQEQLVRQNTLDDDHHSSNTTGRSRRKLRVNASTATSEHQEAFDTTTTVASKHQRRHQQGLYRHRWNK